MSVDSTGDVVGWRLPWRRGREEANAKLVECYGAATNDLLALDREQADLRDLVDAYRDITANRVQLTRATDTVNPDNAPVNVLSAGWVELASEVGDAVDRFLSAQRTYVPGEDVREGDAWSLAEKFDDSSRRMCDATESVCSFRVRYANELEAARLLIRSAPAAFDDAISALAEAQTSVAEAEKAGVYDASLNGVLVAAVEKAGEAESALQQRKWTLLKELSSSVRRTADEICVRASSLAEEGTDVRRGVRSVATRRDIVSGRVSGSLASTMSALRRNYRQNAWVAVEDAERDATDGLRELDAKLSELAVVAVGVPLNVPVAQGLLRDARGCAKKVEDAVESAAIRLAVLDDVAGDPKKVLGALARKSADVRRFVMALPENKRARYSGEFDALAVRVERAEVLLSVPRPDWGKFLGEVAAVEVGFNDFVAKVRAGR